MAEGNTSIGKISLDIDLSQDLQKEIGSTANAISEKLQSGIEKGFDINGMLKNFISNIESSIKKSTEGIQSTIEGSVKNIESKINSTISGTRDKALRVVKDFTSSLKNIKPPSNIPITTSMKYGNDSILKNVGKITVPKVKTSGVDSSQISAMIDNTAKSLDTTNAMIEQQKAKLAELRVSYERAFDGARKNQLEEQMLKTEQNINKLIATSNRLGFTLADLDAQFEKLSSGAKGTSSDMDNVNEKIKSVSSAASSTGSKISNSFNKSGNSVSTMGKMLDRMIIRMALFNTAIKGLSALADFTGNALMTNTAFANSLAQVKSNLEIAFMPIYQACLPAIISLMNALARITTYIAAFISALFGTTYQASANAAKGLNQNIEQYKQMQKEAESAAKANEKLKSSLAGFDEINKLSSGSNSSEKVPNVSGETGIGVPIVTPPIDTSQTSIPMKKIAEIAEKTKKVFKALEPVILGVVGAFLMFKLISGISSIITGAGAAIGFLTSPIGIAILIIGALIAIGVLLYKNWDTIKVKATQIWGDVKNTFASFGSWISTVFSTDWSKNFGILGNVLNGLLASVRSVVNPIIEIFKGLIDFITGIFTGNWSKAWNGVVEIFGGIVNGMEALIKAPLNAVIGLINAAISGLNSISVDIPDWIPGVGGESFGINIPKIPYLATGGIVDQPTLAMVGERGKEAVMPLENNTGWIDSIADRINNKNQSSDEVVSLLQLIIKILQSFSLDVDIDGITFGRVSANCINSAGRQAGKCLVKV